MIDDSEIVELAAPGEGGGNQEPCYDCAGKLAAFLVAEHGPACINTAVAIVSNLLNTEIPPDHRAAIYRALAAGFLRSAAFCAASDAIGVPQGNA